MRVNPVMNTQVHFQRNNNDNQPQQASAMKNIAKAVVVVPLIMPVVVSCDHDPIDIDIDRTHDIHVKDSVTHDSNHDHYETRAINFNDASLDIVG